MLKRFSLWHFFVTIVKVIFLTDDVVTTQQGSWIKLTRAKGSTKKRI
jgi:hypothetical protein